MSSYYRDNGYKKNRNFTKILKPLFLVIALMILIVVGIFGYDLWKQYSRSYSPSAVSKPESTVTVADSQIMSTPYFQINTTRKWKAIANETTSSHYVYRQFSGSLVEQELIVDINNDTTDTLAITRVTRVLPVSATSSNRLSVPGGVSPHCSEIVKPAKPVDPLIVSYQGVKFGCNPTASNYFVVIGLIGGTNSMSLQRPNGSRATYNITYKNVTSQSSSGDIVNIIKTFETR